MWRSCHATRSPRRDRRFWAGKEDSRHVAAEIGGVEVHNVYVPAGGDIADPAANPKFAHKLKFLEELGSGTVIAPAKTTRVLVGDLNVAPYETTSGLTSSCSRS